MNSFIQKIMPSSSVAALTLFVLLFGANTTLALRVPHKFVNDNGINGFLSTQHEPKSYVVKSPESAQYGLWPRWFM